MDRLVTPMMLAGRSVGSGYPCFIIAEAGVNHGGDVSLGRRLVDVAVSAGADAIKFQAFKADRVASAVAMKADYQVQTTGASESQLEMLRRLELSEDGHRELWEYCRRRGIGYLCTPFDEESADFLETLGVEAFKIPSGEITNLPLLTYVAAKGKPMIVSTGMSTQAEVESAVRTVRAAGNSALILMHCVSNYPAQPIDVNLRAIHTMAQAFRIPIGYSDHTQGITVALAAVALGACVIEKHFTVDRSLPGPDHRMSLEPDELASLVREIRTVEISLGHGRKEPAATEQFTAAVARKSLVAARAVSAGTRLTKEHIDIKRPGTGLPPAMLQRVIGCIAAQDIPADALLRLDMLR